MDGKRKKLFALYVLRDTFGIVVWEMERCSYKAYKRAATDQVGFVCAHSDPGRVAKAYSDACTDRVRAGEAPLTVDSDMESIIFNYVQEACRSQCDAFDAGARAPAMPVLVRSGPPSLSATSWPEILGSPTNK